MDCAIDLLSDAHADAILALAREPSLSRTSAVPPGCTERDVSGWIAANAEQPPTMRTFVVLHGGQPAGTVTLKRLDAGDNSGELAYWIGKPFQGRDLARSAARQVIGRAFREMKLDYLHAHYLAQNNPASWRILASLGFQRERDRPDWPTTQGEHNRFADLFPDDGWRFVRLARADWHVG